MRVWIAVRKVLFVLSWIPFLLIKLVLALLGLVVVPIALWRKADMTKLPVWGNREGVLSFWKGSDFWWYAIRNPVNNLRFCFQDPEEFYSETNWSMDSMEAAEMQEAGQAMAYYWRWSGWKSCYRRVWLNDNLHYSEIWFGWKIGSSVPGLGFTSQVRLKRDIGT